MRALSARRRVHFRRAERHDRFGGGQKPPQKVTDPARGQCYSCGRRRPAVGPRKTARGRWRPPSARSSVRTVGTGFSAC